MGLMDHVGTGEYAIPSRLDPSRTDLRDEFMADPFGRHSRDLQLALGAMRGSPSLPRWVLITAQPERSWMVAEARQRGESPRLLSGKVFTDRAAAERYVFDLRWQALTTRRPAHG